MAEENTQEQDFNSLLKRYTISALHNGVLAKGLHEVCKAVEAKNCKFAVLAENCSEATYKKLVVALCKESGIPLLMVKEAEVLGEWLGLSKYDAAGVVRKAKKCSSLALRDFPPEVSEEDRAAFLAKIQ